MIKQHKNGSAGANGGSSLEPLAKISLIDEAFALSAESVKHALRVYGEAVGHIWDLYYSSERDEGYAQIFFEACEMTIAALTECLESHLREINQIVFQLALEGRLQNPAERSDDSG